MKKTLIFLLMFTVILPISALAGDGGFDKIFSLSDVYKSINFDEISELSDFTGSFEFKDGIFGRGRQSFENFRRGI